MSGTRGCNYRLYSSGGTSELSTKFGDTALGSLATFFLASDGFQALAKSSCLFFCSLSRSASLLSITLRFTVLCVLPIAASERSDECGGAALGWGTEVKFVGLSSISGALITSPRYGIVRTSAPVPWDLSAFD